MVVRKSTFWVLAVLAAAAFQAVSGQRSSAGMAGGMSKEARAAHLSKLKAELKLTAEQAAQAEKLLDELEVLRQSIAVAHNALERARKAKSARDTVSQREAAVDAAKEAFRKRQEGRFREILTPEQFNKWQLMNAIPSQQGPAGEHHHRQPGKQ